jgi:hypothetical protein
MYLSVSFSTLLLARSEISSAQGKIINDELNKRAQPVDTNGDGIPDYYVYRP